jgi:peptide/nickel transport system ATP-binding protein/oligopeptide transport system ATP-binding protein
LNDESPLLEIEDLQTWFYTDDGVGKAVDGVSYSIQAGETLGVVGESGCGKSVAAMSILQLVPTPPGKYVGGKIRFRGENLLERSEKQMREIRGKEIAVIFQEPMTSLNPVFQVGDQIGEALRLHEGMSRSQARERSIELLRLVGIPSPETRVSEYPHQLSGGMKQRVMIAMALACNPALLIADEPTTALDVTIQAQILELLRDLQREKGMAILLITHDLGVVAENADQVVVMYAGKVVERAPVDELFGSPRHPYTLGLFRSLPRLDRKSDRLEVIEGNVPNPLDFPSGCKFRPRCRYATDECAQIEPQLQEIDDQHLVACHHWASIVETESGIEGANQ